MKTATIIRTNGPQFPSEVERVYQLRAGSKGTGKILAEHSARGDYRAGDAAVAALTARAEQLGYTLIG